MQEPRTRYTAGREPALAFAVAGEGDGVDVALVGPLLTHLELGWTEPGLRRGLMRLAALGRVVVYDRRGVGLSDPSPGPYVLDDEVDDLIAVLDAAGVGRAAIVSYVDGGPLACLLAARHPDRVASLVLDSCAPRLIRADDYAWTATTEQRAAMIALSRAAWGEGRHIASFAPEWASDPAVLEWMARVERSASSPATMQRLWGSMDDTDVRAVLPSIRAPTLVLRRRDDPRMDRRHAMYLVEHIAGSRMAELEGTDSLPFAGYDDFIDAVGEFVSGSRPPLPATRGLATLLFTDIVDSTAILARVGDTRWRGLLERHDRAAARAITACGGHVVKSLGDGVFARFRAVPDAVGAARTLLGEAPELGLGVRAGVHVGDCELVGDDLAGRTVHEAARIAALARPGELVVSDAARGLLAGAEIGTIDRGLHRLKGFDSPYRLWTVTSDQADSGPSA